jgi:hypothetical protein
MTLDFWEKKDRIKQLLEKMREYDKRYSSPTPPKRLHK